MVYTCMHLRRGSQKVNIHAPVARICLPILGAVLTNSSIAHALLQGTRLSVKEKGSHNMLQAHQRSPLLTYLLLLDNYHKQAATHASRLGMPDSSEMESKRLQPYCEPVSLTLSSR